MPEDFEELLSPNRGIAAKLSQVFECSGDCEVFLLIVDLKNYSSAIVELLRAYQSRKNSGVYVTLNKPVEDLVQSLKTQKISPERLFFIDAISVLSERRALKESNVLFLDSPTDLIDMSNEISKKVSNSPKPDFVVFDSLSTLLLYNKPMAVEKFVHVLVGKMRGSGVQGFLVSVKSSEHSGLIETISQFVDKIVEV